ncbi:uncharacterized protein LOC115579943 [Sparus aurata]|uniref:uncharacterized protein LOC115579943 n=1 Tax=Sparus aurata TaxID=8175 RepID=UPI0011C0DB09|nr:uncharacterized protein LOC115579943 [Sparus aurata]XP_030269576.1 uncharacterized protein LOC115579943 [Sparus aurata]
MQTPSPAGPSQTFKAAACQSPRPAKTVWTPDPSSTCWPWIINDGLSASHSPPKEVPVSSIIRASHSQSDMRYRKFSRNHQCTCMSLTFLAYQNEGCQLNSAALDRVLAKGDSLYVGVKRQLIREKRFHSDHLTVEELPKQVLTDTDMFHLHWPEIRCGPVKASGSQAWGLPASSRRLLHTQQQSASSRRLLHTQQKNISQSCQSNSDEERCRKPAKTNTHYCLKGKKRKKIQYQRKRYSSCPEFRRKKLKAQRRRYAKDSLHQGQRLLSFKCYYENVQDKKKEELVRRYKEDATFRQQRKTCITKKYKEDATFRTRQKKRITDKYEEDATFRTRQKNYIADRYKSNTVFWSRQTFVMSQRYNTDPNYSQKQKQDFNLRYHNDTEFKRRFNQRCNQQRGTKLATNPAFNIFYKMQRALRLKRKYRQIVPHRPQPLINPLMEAAIAAFRESIRHGPTYICTVCHRAQFPNQVKECKRQKYSKHAKVAAACLTGKYVHFCDSDCSTPCAVPQERLHEWICYTCDSYLIRGRIPPMAVINNLELAPIPPKLAVLNMLERQLIAKILPFAKIVALPKGQQRAVHGAVVCVASEVEATVNSLPRPRAEAQLLQVKLKRHIKYKGYRHFYTVNMKNVLAGLATLKETHSEYKDVFIDETATFDCLLEKEDLIEEEESRQEEEPIDDEDPRGR